MEEARESFEGMIILGERLERGERKKLQGGAFLARLPGDILRGDFEAIGERVREVSLLVLSTLEEN